MESCHLNLLLQSHQQRCGSSKHWVSSFHKCSFPLLTGVTVEFYPYLNTFQNVAKLQITVMSQIYNHFLSLILIIPELHPIIQGLPSCDNGTHHTENFPL